jgi:hypothetical protein
MTLSSILAGLMIDAASLALARKLILVSIDIYFMFGRKLLSKLSQCVWKVLSVYLTHAVSDEDAGPGAVIAIQSFGLRLVAPTARRESRPHGEGDDGSV